MNLKNTELRTILTTKATALSAKSAALSVALAKMTPQTLSLAERKILNELGMTVPSDPEPDNPQIGQIHAALDTLSYHAGELKESLATIPADNQKATVTIKNVMAWDMVGDANFAEVSQ